MPSVAEEHPRLVLPGRKRRRDNDPNHMQGPLYEKLAAQYSAAAAVTTNWNADGAFGRPVQQQLLQQQQQPNFFPIFPSSHCHNDPPVFEHGGPGIAVQGQQQNLDAVPRKIAPLPVPKRQRMFDDEDTSIECWEVSDPAISPQRQQRRQSKSPHRGALQAQTDAGNRPKTPSSSLSPCHICHRRPTKKSDLDSFADCQGCGQRTCYVCIRECQGWRKDGQPGDLETAEEEEEAAASLSRSFHMDDVDDTRQCQKDEERANATRGAQQAKRQDGWTGGRHRQMVCSRCCIEKGSEGDIVCLGCLSRMESV